MMQDILDEDADPGDPELNRQAYQRSLEWLRGQMSEDHPDFLEISRVLAWSHGVE